MLKNKKIRIDSLIPEIFSEISRQKAKSLIMAGLVYVNNNKVFKPSEQFLATDEIVIRSNTNQYVSRGGLKLEKALNEFNISLKNKICLDVGCSSGGFTDCMLKSGAKKVFAVDVGKGQLDYSLMENKKVIYLEKYNFRYAKKADFDSEINFVAIDVSFISLQLIFPRFHEILAENIPIIALLKPQFEASKKYVSKGVVDSKYHVEVITNLAKQLENLNFYLNGLIFSPITGAKKNNIEYLGYFLNAPANKAVHVEKIVNSAINYFSKKL